MTAVHSARTTAAKLKIMNGFAFDDFSAFFASDRVPDNSRHSHSILVTADNANTKSLKEEMADSTQYKPVGGKQLSLFQILLSNIAYNVIVEIIYLVILIGIALIRPIIPLQALKYVAAVCIFAIMHILGVLLESVAQMYLTFWRNR